MQSRSFTCGFFYFNLSLKFIFHSSHELLMRLPLLQRTPNFNNLYNTN